MRLYRLEACSCCGAIKHAICSALTEQRERNGCDRKCPDTGVWVVDFCESCSVAYEASITPPAPTCPTCHGKGRALYDSGTMERCPDCKGVK
jgi:hypothetical protein